MLDDENLFSMFYGEDYYTISNIDFIDSNYVSVVLPDTAITFKHNWSLYASEKEINDPIIQKVLQ